VVAFEVARQLEEQGEEVAALMMMDSYNFAFGKFLPRHELIWRNARCYFRRGSAHAKKLAALPAREWARYVAGRMRTLRSHVAELSKMVRGASGNQFPVDPNSVVIEGAGGTELGEILKRVRQEGVIAASKFVPKPYGGRAVVFRAGTRSVIEQYEDEHLGWGPVVRGGIEAIEIEGDHETIFGEPQVRAMAGRVNAKLLEAQPAATVHAAG
jgi:hypothetical protein